MGLFSFIRKGNSRDAPITNRYTNGEYTFLFGGTTSGKRVNEITAMQTTVPTTLQATILTRVPTTLFTNISTNREENILTTVPTIIKTIIPKIIKTEIMTIM